MYLVVFTVSLWSLCSKHNAERERVFLLPKAVSKGGKHKLTETKIYETFGILSFLKIKVLLGTQAGIQLFILVLPCP